MKNILVNGLNSKTGGGKSILVNYLTLLNSQEALNEKYFVLTPNKDEYLQYANSYIEIVDIPSLYKHLFFLPYTYRITLPRLLRKLNINTVFNLADIPITTQTEQIFLFDWPYAVYPESKVWKLMDLKSFLVQKIKLFFFTKNIKYIDKIIAQNDAMKVRLKRLFNFQDISIVPNAVSLDNLVEGKYFDFKLPKGKKLLYLTYYYPHKNLEVFIPLAKLIRDKKLDYKLIITIDKNQHKKAKELLNTIKNNRLDDIIINVGSVSMEYVPELYRQTDGLLMPTLLESFSGTYVEAMFHKKPIFTSNFDFAEAVCREGAFYSDPFDAENILEIIEKAFKNDEYLDKVKKASRRLTELYSWEQAFNSYQKLILEK